MSEVEQILIKAHKKGIYDEVLEEASQLKSSNPDLDLTNRYYIAYYSVKKKKKLNK
jgi:hypothetical protein